MDVEKLVLIGKMMYKTELLDVRRVQERKKEGRCQDLDLKMESRKKRGTGKKKVFLCQNFDPKRRISNKNIYSKKKKRLVPEFLY